MVLVAIIHYFDTMLSLLDGIYLVRVHRLTPRTLSISFAIYILPYLARVHASVSFGYGQERSSRSYDSSTTMKDLVRRIYLLSIATNTCKTYCLTLIKSKLLAGSYDSCFTHLLLRVWGRLARFIYWLLLNHFFLPVYALVYLPHTIKSAVFLL